MDAAEFNKALGAVIRQERQLRGWSMKVLAKMLGYSHQQQQKYENGINVLTAYRLTQFAEIFGLSVALLYDRAGAKIVYHAPSPADDDVTEAARYMRMIQSAFHRRFGVHMLKKLAYEGKTA